VPTSGWATSDSFANTIGPFLSVLRTLPLWILAGLAAAGYAALFAPEFGGVELKPIRQQWGAWFWVEAITFSILVVACAIDALVTYALARRRARADRRALCLVPRHSQSWWHLARQQDDIYISSISLDVEATISPTGQCASSRHASSTLR
jgi:hypothetical protein